MSDFGSDPGVGEKLQQQGVTYGAIDDLHARYTVFQGRERAVRFWQHPVGDGTGFDQRTNFAACQARDGDSFAV